MKTWRHECVAETCGFTETATFASATRKRCRKCGGIALKIEAAIVLSDSALERHLRHRVGYGRLDAPFMFLGMEEACGGPHELERRLSGEPIEDLFDAHARLSPTYDDLFDGEDARLQSTWRPLIGLKLISEGADPSSPTFTVDMRRYQAGALGRMRGDTLLAELLPLPSPSLREWFYERTERFPELESRRAYERAWLPRRVEMLRNLWESWRAGPHVTIAYGKRNWTPYLELFGEEGWDWLSTPACQRWALAKVSQDRLVVLVPHPVSAEPKACWISVGQFVRDWLEFRSIPVLE